MIARQRAPVAIALGLGLVLVLVAGACSDSENDDRGTRPQVASTTTSASGEASASTTPGDTAPASSKPPPVQARPIAEFDQPLMLAPVPRRSGAFYIVEKPGRIRLMVDGSRGDTVLDIADDVSGGGERGLLGLAIAPDGAHAYINYTDREGDTRIVEYAIAGDGTFDTVSRRELLKVDQPYANHNGGHLEFGPDDMLYIALGDGGSGGDPKGNAQNLGTLLGKILRIRPLPGNDSPRYAIPEDNPFNGTDAARAEIWAYGLRNPWRFSFDRVTGTLWIGDVGQSSREEIDRAPDGSKGGENYGWDRFEGREPFEGRAPAEHVLPVFDYARDDGNCAVTGGHVYRGTTIPGLEGWYVFGDYCRGELMAMRADAEAPARAVSLDVRVESLASFADDGTGELYLLSLQGTVYLLEPRTS